MPTEQEIIALQREWEAEGLHEDEIGARLKELVEREGVAAEDASEPEPQQEPPAPAATDFPEGMPLCPICKGLGRVPEELVASTTRQTCPDCNGLGMVRTGSLVPEEAIKDCEPCLGRGWVDKVRSREYVEPARAEYDRRY